MNNLSNDRLAEYANDKRMCNVSDEIVSMARELLALREAGKEPFGYTDGPRHGMCYEPRHAERLMDAHPLYAAPQLPAVDSIQRYTAANTQFGGVSLRPDGDGDYVRFEDVRAMIAAAPKPEAVGLTIGSGLSPGLHSSMRDKA
ncbi:Uncharacterised protein [Cedecea lapagei]|uniref:Uncharacterized protein n=1 Tax=Cedecea lapagei TaxID=158823 RepID=A0A3S4KW07_9ENTR|nr:hypothetical protein [Cedecea lapagei]VEC00273.1 Uncharacterised protein [Cedecea lapagei]